MPTITQITRAAIRRPRKPRWRWNEMNAVKEPGPTHPPEMDEAVAWKKHEGIEDTAGNVTAWRDVGTVGAAFDLTSITGTPTTTTLSGKAAVQFGTGNYMATAAQQLISQPFTFAALIRTDAITTSQYIFDNTVVAPTSRLGTALSAWRIYAGGAAVITTLGITEGETTAVVAVFNGAASYVKSPAGSETVNPGTDGLNAYTLGALATGGTGWLGPVGEHAFWNRALSDLEASSILDYLVS